MPTPNEEETRREFIIRCIPIVARENDKATKSAVIAKCFSIWNRAKTEGLK